MFDYGTDGNEKHYGQVSIFIAKQSCASGKAFYNEGFILQSSYLERPKLQIKVYPYFILKLASLLAQLFNTGHNLTQSKVG